MRRTGTSFIEKGEFYMEEKEYWYWLSKVEEAGTAAREVLFRYFASPGEIFAAGEKILSKVDGLNDKIRKALLSEKYRSGFREEFHKLKEQDIYFVTKQEDNFPERLREIPQPPDFIFYRGRLPEPYLPAVAVIGARECSVYGRRIAQELAGELAAAGIAVISGMARGIDGYAQRAALHYGKSYAVLGSGVDVCYPAENFSLYEELEEKGGILSEYPPGSPGLPWHFPLRNRLISGLADGVAVVEARKRSGTLITVDYALEQGKEVFAVPGKLGESLSEGCNELIRQGACMILGSRDIAEELLKHYPALRKAVPEGKKNFILEQQEKIVYAYLSLEPRHIEELVREVDFTLPELMKLLFSLEEKGAVYSPAGNYYAAVSRSGNRERS